MAPASGEKRDLLAWASSRGLCRRGLPRGTGVGCRRHPHGSGGLAGCCLEQVLHPSCCLFPSPPFVVLLDGVPLKSPFLVCPGVLRVGSREPCGSFTYPGNLAATIWALRQLFLDSCLCQRVCLSISTLAVVGPLRSWQWGLWGREQDQGCSLGPNSRLGAALSFDPPQNLASARVHADS